MLIEFLLTYLIIAGATIWLAIASQHGDGESKGH
jgi:hypothetical protein